MAINLFLSIRDLMKSCGWRHKPFWFAIKVDRSPTRKQICGTQHRYRIKQNINILPYSEEAFILYSQKLINVCFRKVIIDLCTASQKYDFHFQAVNKCCTFPIYFATIWPYHEYFLQFDTFSFFLGKHLWCLQNIWRITKEKK